MDIYVWSWYSQVLTLFNRYIFVFFSFEYIGFPAEENFRAKCENFVLHCANFFAEMNFTEASKNVAEFHDNLFHKKNNTQEKILRKTFRMCRVRTNRYRFRGKEQIIIVKTTWLGTDMEWFTKPNNFGVKITFSRSFFKKNWPGEELGLKFTSWS